MEIIKAKIAEEPKRITGYQTEAGEDTFIISFTDTETETDYDLVLNNEDIFEILQQKMI